MARSYGINTKMRLKREVVYGDGGTGNFVDMPFVSSTLGAEQGLLEDDILGLGRDPADPTRDVINADGDAVVPVDENYFGYWLTALLGDTVTTGVNPDFTHTWQSGAAALPSYGIELGHPDVPSFFWDKGVRADSLNLQMTRSGQASATFGLIAQGEDRAGVSNAGTPTSHPLVRFGQFQGSIKDTGVDVAGLVSADLTYSNNLERVETIRDDGKIEDADPTRATFGGSITVRFANTTLLDQASAGTPIDLAFAFTRTAARLFRLTGHRLFLPVPKQTVEGPGGIEATYEFQGANDSGAGAMLTAELLNGLDGTAYA